MITALQKIHFIKDLSSHQSKFVIVWDGFALRGVLCDPGFMVKVSVTGAFCLILFNFIVFGIG